MPWMVKSTQIVRVQDGLPLAASVDDEQEEGELSEYKSQAKQVFRRLSANSEPRASIESGKGITLHYLIQEGICYLCICDRSYPRKLAFSYLEELAKEFDTSYGSEAQKQGIRPYAFVGFDVFMQRTKRLYQDTRTTQNLDKLNADLQDVTRVMTKNIEDLLYRGDSLDRMQHMSSSLRDESIKYRKAARRINLQALWRQYGPVGLVGLVILILIWWRFF